MEEVLIAIRSVAGGLNVVEHSVPVEGCAASTQETGTGDTR